MFEEIVSELMAKEKYKFTNDFVITQIVKDTLQIINNATPEKKFDSVKSVPFTNIILNKKENAIGNPAFQIILLAVLTNSKVEFITYVHHIKFDSISSGRNFTNLKDAIEDFDKREN